MATSGTDTYATSGTAIIKGALRKLSVLAAGASPTTSQQTDALEALNLIAKNWQGKGLRFWTRTTSSVTLVSGTASYTLTTTPTRVLGVWRRDSNGNDTPVRIISKDEYERLSDKDAPGVPTLCWIDEQLSSVTAYTWPVIDESGWTLRLDIEKRIEDFSAAADEPHFPQEWYLPLVYRLAIDLAPEYGKEPKQSVYLRAAETLEEAENSDYESSTSIYIHPRLR